MPLSDIDIDLDNNSEFMVDLDDDENEMMRGIVLDASKSKKRAPAKQNEGSSSARAPVSSFMAFANKGKQNEVQRPVNQNDEEDDDEDQDQTGYDIYGGDNNEFDENLPSAGYKTIEDEKADLINKIARLEKKGIQTNERLNMHSSIQDIRNEVKRMSYSVEVDQSVKFQRRILIACVTGIEFLNKRYNPLDIHLDGWSESVMDGVDEYDDVFEELYIKYRGKAKMAPELRLMMMLGGSATMFHLTHSMFKSAMPQMNDVIKQNPDLIKNMMSAMANTANNAKNQNMGPPPPQVPRRDVQGPNVDLSSLMGQFMMPQSTTNRDLEEKFVQKQQPNDNASSTMDFDDISDIVSEEGSVREVEVPAAPKRKRGGGRKPKNSVVL